MARVVLVVLFIVLQAVCGTPDYLSGEGDLLLRASTYHFFHASWWHLAVNAIATWSVFSFKKRPCNPCKDFLFSYIIAVLVYPIASRPVVGFSNILYAAIGLRTPALFSPWWKKTEVIVFIAVTLLLLLVPRFSAVTHIVAFVAGVLCAAAGRWYNDLTKDARRYY